MICLLGTYYVHLLLEFMVRQKILDFTNEKTSSFKGALSHKFVIFKPLSYCLEETIGFDVKALFVNRPMSRLIRWYNTTGDIIKEFW